MKTAVFVLAMALASLPAPAQLAVKLPPEIPPRHLSLFGGDSVKLHLEAWSSNGDPVSLAYSLFQITSPDGNLAAPLEVDKSLGPAVDLGPGRRRVIPVEIPVPPVERATPMIVRFLSSAPTVRDRLPENQVSLKVFPKPKPGEWSELLAAAEKRSGLQLAVFGKSPALREFFREHGVAFRDLGEDYPDRFPAHALVVAEVSAIDFEKHRPRVSGGRKILFVSDSLQLAGIYQTIEPGGSLTKVTLPIPAGLAGDPQSQVEFLTLLEQHLNPAESQP
jgi:hypothetical protein